MQASDLDGQLDKGIQYSYSAPQLILRYQQQKQQRQLHSSAVDKQNTHTSVRKAGNSGKSRLATNKYVKSSKWPGSEPDIGELFAKRVPRGKTRARAKAKGKAIRARSSTKTSTMQELARTFVPPGHYAAR